MTKRTSAAAAILVLWVALAAPALADKVTLTNGDVLHGEVREEAGRVHIRHPILGDVALARSDVMWIAKEGEVPPEPPPPKSLTARSTGSDSAAAAAEAACVERRRSPWDFSIGFGATSDTGNTDKIQVNADLEAGHTRGPNEFRWRVNSFYEEADGVQTEGKYFSNLRYLRRISPRGRLFAMALTDRDDFADIELRQVLAAGYVHDFLRREKTSFSGAVGAGHAWEKRKGQARIETPVLLAWLHYQHEFTHGDIFEGTLYVVPYLDHTELSPSRLELRYAHPLRDHFDLTAGLLLDYVPEPPEGIEPHDLKVTFGVRYKR